MKRILFVFLNPFLLSLWVSILVLLFFPPGVQKYSAKILESGSFADDLNVRYDDLDQDGISERLFIFHNNLGAAGLTVSSPDGFLKEWVFRGRYDFILEQGIVITGDRDQDGMKEIYIFTIQGDSILLHCIPNFRKPDSIWVDKFITLCGTRDKRADPYIIPAIMEDLTGDGSGELIFGIGTGYSLYPRRIYAYDRVRDTFFMSPPSGYYLQGILQIDIAGDEKKEIIPYGYASGNFADSAVPCSDQKNWLLVLDQNLHYVFNPVPFPGRFYNLMPFAIETGNGKPILAALHRPPENLGDTSEVYYFDPSGHITRKIVLPGNTLMAFTTMSGNGKKRILICHSQTIELYDEFFHRIRSVKKEVNHSLQLLDIDQDGIEEVIIPDIFKRQLTIYRSDLTNPLVLAFNGNGHKGIVYSIKKTAGTAPQVFLQMGFHFLLFKYERNPRYNFRFLFFAGVYLSIFLFTLLVRKIQQVQLHKKQETEKKITNLQLQIVRNQLDPHFIMNAINSIIASITDENKEEARLQLLHFSKLHRILLLSSDRIYRSLREEIDFTENYLALEKFRFKDSFHFTIEVNPMVNLEIQIPKMILQIHAENAVKHGLLISGSGGSISIRVSEHDNGVVLEVIDNGKGREYARCHGTGSTGRGLAIMDQYQELFNRYQKGKIITEIKDIFDPDGNSHGTHVTITLSEFV
jgi:hypothetical protein